ncbi:MAG: spore maturation protein [Acidobacteria bacterium]|nr:spore maturation protein [Acidobacteriota bacterium]NIM64002.1 spore maturation protein [Acidobacteriota bacterium]NIO60208.1 spore maturation protein [Acidobacteriota bacterium]NIQ31270.1 spore maturation protein [Acidobacteriota bacterium]NIQ86418.1 spore maturation protein [Acidobacteriota bacterium]
MLNGIFVFLVLASLLLAAWSGRMEALNASILQSAKDAVGIALGLIGVMALFLGLMRVVQLAGLMSHIARAIAPLTRRLFPGVPEDHPAMSAMIMNMSCNMLGLGNAATPFGIKAMEELDRLNTAKGTATNAMVLFLAINTAGFAILPTSAIAIRASLDSADPTGILFPTWVASGCAMLAGILAAWFLAKLPAYRASEPASAKIDPGAEKERPSTEVVPDTRRWAAVAAVLAGLVYAALLVRHVALRAGSVPAFDLFRDVLSFWMLPPIVAGCVAYGWAKGVRVYDALVEGAKEGFQVALRIIPYLVAILVAVGMFRASGGIAILVDLLSGITTRIGMPAEALPMALLRPLTGSGAQGVMTEVMRTHGPDSFVGYMVSTFQGSTETTFYVLAVYFGAIGVKRTRHTLPACLAADITGILIAVLVVNLLFG